MKHLCQLTLIAASSLLLTPPSFAESAQAPLCIGSACVGASLSTLTGKNWTALYFKSYGKTPQMATYSSAAAPLFASLMAIQRSCEIITGTGTFIDENKNVVTATFHSMVNQPKGNLLLISAVDAMLPGPISSVQFHDITRDAISRWGLMTSFQATRERKQAQAPDMGGGYYVSGEVPATIVNLNYTNSIMLTLPNQFSTEERAAYTKGVTIHLEKTYPNAIVEANFGQQAHLKQDGCTVATPKF